MVDATALDAAADLERAVTRLDAVGPAAAATVKFLVHASPSVDRDGLPQLGVRPAVPTPGPDAVGPVLSRSGRQFRLREGRLTRGPRKDHDMIDDDVDRRAGAIIEAVVGLPPADRAAAAEAACGADADLLRQVRSLLSAPTADIGDTAGDTAGETAAAAGLGVDAKPGDRIGPYKLLEQIGEGGFGVVFKAGQERPVRRQVAVKVLKLGMDTKEVVARFEAERQALALMDHPNIAKVLDAGATAAGRPYFVMELVRGSPITDYCDKRQLTTAQRVALVADVCRAVQHAHAKGVIRRDLKPSNVLVTVTDDRPTPKVIDFGIAKATQGRLADRTLFTAFRQLIGTPQYMSPEQADSDGTDVDTRTDVYSLGVLLYELLVGTTPLDARSLRSAAVDAMRRMIREADPPRPSTKLSGLGETAAAVATNRGTDARHLGQLVRGELDWIVMRALEKDRSRRYDTAAALADDLNRHLAGEAVLAGPVSGTYRLRKAVRRHRAAVGVAAAVAAALLLGVAGTTAGLVSANRQAALARRRQDEAEVARAQAQASRDQSDAVVRFLTKDLLAKASPTLTHDSKASGVLVKAMIEPAVAVVGQRFAGQPLVRATVQDTLAATLNELGRSDLALPLAKAAWDARRAGLGDDAADTVTAALDYATAAYDLGRFPEAADVYHAAWDRARSARGDDDPETIRAMGLYGNALHGLKRFAEFAGIERQVWDRYRRVRGDGDANTIRSLGSYGVAMTELGKYDEAADLLKRASTQARQSLGDADPTTASTLLNYAGALYHLGRGAEAADVFKQVWNIRRRVLGDGHRDTIRTMVNYAVAASRLGRGGEAADVLRQASAQARRSLGDIDPDAVRATTTYAGVLVGLGRGDDAVAMLQDYNQTLRRTHPDDPSRGPAMYALGVCLSQQGKWASAEPVLRENWAWDRAHPDPTRPPGPPSQVLLNQCLRELGKPPVVSATTAATQ